MIEVVKKHHFHGEPPETQYTLVLNYDERTKGRLRATTSDGQDIGLFLERGKVLRNGDILESKAGEFILVVSQKEELVEASCEDWLTFSRCCYHLGNRHVPIQITERKIRMRPDHILEDMVERLGMRVERVSEGFDPEQGAYASGHHHH